MHVKIFTLGRVHLRVRPRLHANVGKVGTRGFPGLRQIALLLGRPGASSTSTPLWPGRKPFKGFISKSRTIFLSRSTVRSYTPRDSLAELYDGEKTRGEGGNFRDLILLLCFLG